MGISQVGELASDGNVIYPDMCEHAYGYDASGNLVTDTVQAYSGTYVKTYTWTSGALTGESLWVRQ